MNIDALIKKELNTKSLDPLGISAGGCISQGTAYMTDFGKIFLKSNSQAKAEVMFDGEYNSLKAIAATNTIKCPKPYKVINDVINQECFLAVEYIDIKSSVHQQKLGEQLAMLHLHNHNIKKNFPDEYIDKFGFSVATCCGYIPQINTWNSNWIDFLINQRLQVQIDMIEKEYKDSECIELWERVKLIILGLFKIPIFPSLLHGDLWSGNIGETSDCEPVIFDPASFYGHHEYDLGIARMFGGFTPSFYSSYHALIPKTEGFEKRNQLYQLFHSLNHWNHFGVGYKSSSIRLMKNLLN